MDPSLSLLDDTDEPLTPRRPLVDDARFDITAMVDLVFMMNIFFLVTWITSALAEVDLPAARRCVAADEDTSVIMTVISGGEREVPLVYLGEARNTARPVDAESEQMVRAAVEAGMREGKNAVLIKGERDVREGFMARIAHAAGSVEGVKLNVAVVEKE